MNNELIYDPFAGAEVCNCKTIRPKEIETIIPKGFSEEDEFYVCNWCRFIRKFGMVDALSDIEKEISGETEVDDVEYEEWENMQGLRDLEDWGAFSDEGIMPGCHSDYYCGFDLEEYKEYERMRQFFGAVLKFARESVGLSTKKLAECMKLPEYIIENIENGEEYIKDKARESVLTVSPILVEIPVTSANSVIEKQWWEELYDSDIERKILDFLLEYKSKL